MKESSIEKLKEVEAALEEIENTVQSEEIKASVSIVKGEVSKVIEEESN